MRKILLMIGLMLCSTLILSGQTTTALSSGNWSDASIWSNGIPDNSKNTIIGQGISVNVDGEHQAGTLTVHGNLNVFENIVTTKSITTRWVHVNSGGVFQIGTASNSYDIGTFTLTLTGTDPNSTQSVPMANGALMDIRNNDGFLMAGGGGRLQFFGQDKLPFTKLSETAAVGTNSIIVENIIDRNHDGILSSSSDGQVNWEVGDQIVIASSSTVYTEEDVRTITAVQNLGSTTRYTLNSALTYMHHGEIEVYGNDIDSRSISPGGSLSMDMRAEVALLSRNVKIQGTAVQDTDGTLGDRANLVVGNNGKATNGVGGHIMIMPSAGQISVEGVQLDLMGQAGRLGRYPFHWHVARDRRGDYFKNSSITNSNNRGVVVHTTDNTVVEGIVLHDAHGHGFFTEDGVELNNKFINNIAFAIHRVHPDNDREGAAFVVDETDRFFDRTDRSRTTSAFWVANAGNDYIGNVVAGCEGSGFWFGQPARPRGAASQIVDYTNFLPRETPLATFNHNTIHSSVTGFVVALNGAGAPNGLSGGPFGENERTFGDVDPVYDNTTIYLTSIGLYPLVSNVRHTFPNFKAADNNFFSWDSDPTLIKDALIIGRSRANLNQNGREVAGVALYHGNTIIERAHIAGFRNRARFFIPQGGGNRVRSGAEVERLSYENDGSYGNMSATQATDFNNIRDVYDRDGTLTTPFGGGAGYSFTAVNDWAIDESLGDIVENRSNRFRATVSKQRFVNLETPTSSNAALESRTPKITFTSPHGLTRDFVKRNNFNQRRISLRMNGEYTVNFPEGFDSENNALRITLHQWSMPSNSVGVVLRMVNQANNIKPKNTASGIDLERVNTLQALRNANVDSYFTANNNDLYVRIMNRGQGIHGNFIDFVGVSEASCDNSTEISTEYFIDGTRGTGQDFVNIAQDQSFTISGFPDFNTYTITRPNGTEVLGDVIFDSFRIEDEGTYTITNQFGCSKQLRVIFDRDPKFSLSLNKPATQSSGTNRPASRAVDGFTLGNANLNSVSQTETEVNPWWRVDLQGEFDIDSIVVSNRYEFRPERNTGARVLVGNVNSTNPADFTEVGVLNGSEITNTFSNLSARGRYVLIHFEGRTSLNLAEVEVYGEEELLVPPSVSFSNIREGQTFDVGEDLYVLVNATDTDGTIANVRLFIDGAFIRQEGLVPYEWGLAVQNDALLQNVQAGAHTLKAVATDNDGQTSEEEIDILVQNPLVVSFSNIGEGQIFDVGEDLYVLVNATASGTIANVRLFIDGTLIRQENLAPYEWGLAVQNDILLENLQAGNYTLRAVAQGDNGVTSEASVNIIVNDNIINGATLFTDCNFEGESAVFEVGIYDFGAFTSRFSNDRLSSIRIPDGLRATLYQHGGFNGRSLVLTNDDTCLNDNNFDNQTSTLVVEQINEVTVFADCNFGGESVAFEIGRYDFGAFTSRFPNDRLSSIDVPSGLKVTLYQHGGFNGRSLVLTNDDTCLNDNNFDNQTSTLVVEQANEVTFFADCSFGGESAVFEVGEYDFGAFTSRFPNDRLSSVDVPNGLKVTLYQHGGFNGRTLELTNDTDCLGDANFDNQASSVVVERIGGVISKSLVTSELNNISIYPNPVNRDHILNIAGASNGNIVQILDVNGIGVMKQTIVNGVISTKGLASGVYFVTIKGETFKLLVN